MAKPLTSIEKFHAAVAAKDKKREEANQLRLRLEALETEAEQTIQLDAADQEAILLPYRDKRTACENALKAATEELDRMLVEVGLPPLTPTAPARRTYTKRDAEESAEVKERIALISGLFLGKPKSFVLKAKEIGAALNWSESDPSKASRSAALKALLQDGTLKEAGNGPGKRYHNANPSRIDISTIS
jgi:hypothetical protein